MSEENTNKAAIIRQLWKLFKEREDEIDESEKLTDDEETD